MTERTIPVLIAGCYKSGWYTFHKIPDLVLDENIINLVRERKDSTIESRIETASKIEAYCDEIYDDEPYYGETIYLEVDYVFPDTPFTIENHLGWEQIVYKSEGELCG